MDEPGWEQQEQDDRERWEKDVRALVEAYRKGVSRDSLLQLCSSTGIPYRFITDEVRLRA